MFQAPSSNKKEIARGRAASKSIADELNAKLNKSMADELNAKLNKNNSEPKPTITKGEPEPVKRSLAKSGMFDSDDEDMFAAEEEKPAKVETPKAQPKAAAVVSIFDDSDSEDMFSVKPKIAPVSEPMPSTVKQKAEPRPVFQTKGLFDDSDSDDMFAVAPKQKASPKTEAKPAEPTPKAVESPKIAKHIVPSIFDDSDSDDMFVSIKHKAAPTKVKSGPVVDPLFDDLSSPTNPSKASKDSFFDDSLTETSPTVSVSTDAYCDTPSEAAPVREESTERSPLLQSEDEDDMFGNVTQKENVSRDSMFKEAKVKPNVSNDSLFDDSPPSPTPVVAQDNLYGDKPYQDPFQSHKITGISHNVFESPPKNNISEHILSDDDRLFDSPPNKNVDRDSLFDDEKMEPPTMDNDLFGNSPPEEAPIKKSRDSLFEDDMLTDPKPTVVTQDDDIFREVAKPSNNVNIPLPDDKPLVDKEMLSNKNNAAIKSKKAPKDDFDLFGDDGADDLFAVVSPRDRAISRSKSKPVDPEFDLFADTR